MKNERGFTLLEVLVTLAILTVMIGLSLTQGAYSNDKAKFQGLKVQLRDTLQLARNTARINQECVSVFIVAQQITVTSYPPGTPCVFPFAVAGTATAYPFAPAALTQFNLGNPLIFNQNGGTTFANSSTMSIQGYGFTANYIVYPVLGQIEEQ